MLYFKLIGVSVPTVNLSCGSNNRVCSGAYIAYKCNVTSTALVWKIIGPEPAEITLTQFDKIGTNIKYLDLIVAVVNVTTMAQPFLASEIEFFASEKYNNTKFYCADGVKGENSTFFCSPKLFSKSIMHACSLTLAKIMIGYVCMDIFADILHACRLS